MGANQKTAESRIRQIADSFLRVMRRNFQSSIRTSPKEAVYYDDRGVESGRITLRKMRHEDRTLGARKSVPGNNGDHRAAASSLERARLVRCEICNAEGYGTFTALRLVGWKFGPGLEFCPKH